MFKILRVTLFEIVQVDLLYDLPCFGYAWLFYKYYVFLQLLVKSFF